MPLKHTIDFATFTCMYQLLRSTMSFLAWSFCGLETNDKSNGLAPLSARFLDCMAGIHSELEPEVKISLTKNWIVASHRPAEQGAHESQRRAQAESSSAWSQSRLTRRASHCFQLIARGRLLLITVLGPLLPAVGGRRLCCLFL
jgi:hypothetical protein